MEWLKSTFQKREEISNCDETNGLVLNNIGLPEEIIVIILSYTDIKTILKCKLVCKRWNELIKSHHLWRLRLSGTNITVRNEWPWYTYYCALAYNKNLLKNGNGQQGLKHWKIRRNGGDHWVVEDTPNGAHLLPENQLEFNESSKCFATSFGVCSKFQVISFEKSPLVMKVLDEIQPKIYISEWFCGRFDCGCRYKLAVTLWNKKEEIIYEKSVEKLLEQWSDPPWEKVEIICKDYGQGLAKISFLHEGADTQFWKGHYGSKMAGGVVKILFD